MSRQGPISRINLNHESFPLTPSKTAEPLLFLHLTLIMLKIDTFFWRQSAGLHGTKRLLCTKVSPQNPSKKAKRAAHSDV
jgi:hypothetical protein